MDAAIFPHDPMTAQPKKADTNTLVRSNDVHDLEPAAENRHGTRKGSVSKFWSKRSTFIFGIEIAQKHTECHDLEML